MRVYKGYHEPESFEHLIKALQVMSAIRSWRVFRLYYEKSGEFGGSLKRISSMVIPSQAEVPIFNRTSGVCNDYEPDPKGMI